MSHSSCCCVTPRKGHRLGRRRCVRLARLLTHPHAVSVYRSNVTIYQNNGPFFPRAIQETSRSLRTASYQVVAVVVSISMYSRYTRCRCVTGTKIFAFRVSNCNRYDEYASRIDNYYRFDERTETQRSNVRRLATNKFVISMWLPVPYWSPRQASLSLTRFQYNSRRNRIPASDFLASARRRTSPTSAPTRSASRTRIIREKRTTLYSSD